MRKFKIVDKDRFNRFTKMLVLVLVVIWVGLFIGFMYENSGLEPMTTEYYTYETAYQTSPYSNRVKVPVIQKVVYRKIYH